MRNSRQYYEQNYSNIETSEVIIDALEDISADVGIEFRTLWENGHTEDISHEQIIRMVVNHIRENVAHDELDDVYYWGVSPVYMV